MTAAAVAGTGLHLNRPPPGRCAARCARPFAIESGETFGSISQRLRREGIIRSPLVFRVLAGVRGSDTAIQAGHFQLPAGATTVQVLDLLVDASQHLSRVTHTGGLDDQPDCRLPGADRRGRRCAIPGRGALGPRLMEDLGIAAHTAEGYLFPDTYYFPPEYGAEAVVRHMVGNFFARLDQIDPGSRADPVQLHATVTLASIVEREYRLPGEAPIIASVFYNRLRGKARLESCATIQYIITELQGKEHRSASCMPTWTSIPTTTPTAARGCRRRRSPIRDSPRCGRRCNRPRPPTGTSWSGIRPPERTSSPPI